MKLSVVLNGMAGALLDQPVEVKAAELEALFEQCGNEAEITFATGPEIVAAIERAIGSDADAIVVGGGDGTIATAAHRLAGTGKALGILPLGTANLLARDLGIPLDLEQAIRALAGGTIRAIDVGEVNGHIFVNNSVIGLFPKMARQRERQRGRMGLWNWFKMVIGTLRSMNRYPRLRIGVDMGAGPRRISATSVMIANNAYDDGFGALFSRSRLDAGELVLYVVRHRSLFALLRLAVAMLLGTWQQDRDLAVVRLRRLVVTSRKKALTVSNDGEVMLLPPPLRYRIRPGALKVLVPAASPAGSEAVPTAGRAAA